MRIVLCYAAESPHVARIQAVAPAATIVNAGQEGIAAEIHQADIFCGHAKVPVDWPRVVRTGRLQWIQSSAAGLDHCLVPCVIEAPILVTSASGLFAPQVAEHALALLLGFLRRLPLFVRAQQRREFVRRPTDDLRGKTVGIVGFGGNGRRIAQVLAPFEARMLATDWYPHDRPDYVESLWAADELPRLVAASDVVILCVPLNEHTHGLVDAALLRQFRPGALLINVARGPVVREEDLVAALRSGRLGGAALDVTQTEPLPADSPLWERDDVIITPHVGAQSARRLDDCTALFCDNLSRYLAGRPLRNLVDKQLGFPIPSMAGCGGHTPHAAP